ncbi:ammonia-forming cytochrome c nitrite reductase subunit c552 [Ferrimonas pelagia]|uniref:nitrite reductase (cytochrome; ammonia-forming) n=1 Tax=Ferrimonas pelagia TaxID=1177826 RepID=A0ABP9F7B9_9GAMM
MLNGAYFSCGSLITLLILSGCYEPQPFVDNASQAESYPQQFQDWQATGLNSQRDDLLAQRPALVILWAGSAYAKEFHSPRGHRFAPADVSHTLRTAQPRSSTPEPDAAALSASCWTCKSPDSARMIEQQGQSTFSASSFYAVGPQIENSIGCSDCHDPQTQALRLARPQARDAMAYAQQTYSQQSRAMQAAQTCGQCHVTYYFQRDNHNKVVFPWMFGSTAAKILKYYDERRFVEWIHPISHAPMLKARHPEYETWSRSQHADVGVTCIDCHMPMKTTASGEKVHEHRILAEETELAEACAQCHREPQAVWRVIQLAKQELEQARDEVESLLVYAHYEAGAAREAGATFEELAPVLVAIRHSQWYWDFAVASHGVYAHNPQEARQLLNEATQIVLGARAELASLLSARGVSAVPYPDLSSKAAAQAAIDLDVPKLIQSKKDYLLNEVDSNWPAVNRLGY